MKKDKKKGGLRKISDIKFKKRCLSPEHNPPTHMYLEPGEYEYTCPSCGHVTTFIVPEISCTIYSKK